MERLELIDAELAELEKESKHLQFELAEPGLAESERARIKHVIGIIDSRWVLGQFEALQVLTSVARSSVSSGRVQRSNR